MLMNISQRPDIDPVSGAPSSFFSRRSPSTEIGDFAKVPSCHIARTLVFCFDSNSGLGSKYRTHHSNLYQFFDLLSQNDNNQQMCFSPLPMEVTSDRADRHRNWRARGTVIGDKDFAIGLDFDITNTYRDLMFYYRPGDKICLFGFSRGAYTARALAEMIHKVGLLPQRNCLWARCAYSLYLRDVDDRWHQLYATFRTKCNPMKIDVDFVGVWDTLSSVGNVLPSTFPFTRSNTSIRVFRQALALHERWAHLHPKFYELDAQNAEDRPDIQEVWFAGSHCDVGGCAVAPDTPHSLGRISLRWMVRECFRANTGIQFKAEELRKIGLDPTSLYPVVKERPCPLKPRYHYLTTIAPPVPTASEEEHDVRDALSPMHDQLAVYTPLWWAMEIIPMSPRRIPVGPPSEWSEDSEPKVIRYFRPRHLPASRAASLSQTHT